MKYKILLAVIDLLITIFLLTSIWATHSLTFTLEKSAESVNYFATTRVEGIPVVEVYRVNVTSLDNLTLVHYLELPEATMPMLLKGRYPKVGECVVTAYLYSQIGGDRLELNNLTCNISGVVSLWRAINSSNLVMIRSEGEGTPVYVIKLDPNQEFQVIASHPELISLGLPALSKIMIKSSLDMLDAITLILTVISLISSTYLSFMAIRQEELGKWALKTAMGRTWWTSILDVLLWTTILFVASLVAFQITSLTGREIAEFILGSHLSDVWREEVPFIKSIIPLITFPTSYLVVGMGLSVISSSLPLSRGL